MLTRKRKHKHKQNQRPTGRGGASERASELARGSGGRAVDPTIPRLLGEACGKARERRSAAHGRRAAVRSGPVRSGPVRSPPGIVGRTPAHPPPPLAGHGSRRLLTDRPFLASRAAESVWHQLGLHPQGSRFEAVLCLLDWLLHLWCRQLCSIPDHGSIRGMRGFQIMVSGRFPIRFA